MLTVSSSPKLEVARNDQRGGGLLLEDSGWLSRLCKEKQIRPPEGQRNPKLDKEGLTVVVVVVVVVF